MPTLNEIFNLKDNLIDARRAQLEGSITAAQRKLLKEITDLLIQRLDVQNGLIVSSYENQRVLDALNQLYTTFQKDVMLPIAASMASTFGEIASLNIDYFKELVTNGVGITGRQVRLFKGAARAAEKAVKHRVGIETKTGKLIKGAFLDNFVSDTTARAKIQQFALRGITGGMSLSEFTSQLAELVTGAEGKDGVLESYARTYAYDTYQEYDRVMGAKVAEGIGLRAFIYQGGLMGDSREFCQDHNGYVYTVDEAQTWRTWTPAKAENKTFPDAKNPNSVPSYIAKFPGYDPIANCGGFNCRHSCGWITDGEAIRRRPELEEVLTD